MTMAEATEIADNALEHSVRCILQAVQVGALGGTRIVLCDIVSASVPGCNCKFRLRCHVGNGTAAWWEAATATTHALQLLCLQAQEILKSSRGALMWHGRDLRHFKRILSPPLQQLLTQPGTAVLGRGLASMPAAAAHQMGAAQVGGPKLREAGCQVRDE